MNLFLICTLNHTTHLSKSFQGESCKKDVLLCSFHLPAPRGTLKYARNLINMRIIN